MFKPVTSEGSHLDQVAAPTEIYFSQLSVFGIILRTTTFYANEDVA